MVASFSIRHFRFRFLSGIIIFFFLISISGNPLVLDSTKFSSSQSESGSIDYLIITGQEYESVLFPLAEWKMQRGLLVAIETVEDIAEQYEGEDAEDQIRNCIIHYYENRDTKWVLLAGGHRIVPTRSVRVSSAIVSCDSYYSNLDENWEIGDRYTTLIDSDDWGPEVYVGRLPADDGVEMTSLVSKLIDYERNPPVGNWMQHAVYAGTFCNFDYDVNGNNIFDDGDFPAFDTNFNHNWMKDNLLPDDWTSTCLAETQGLRTTDCHCDCQLNETTLVTAINNGASIVMADAHGSPTGMYRTVFTADIDGDGLFDSGIDQQLGTSFLTTSTEFDTDGKYGFYFLAACSTGTITEGTCLTEYIARTSGIGCIGSSKSASYDPYTYTYGGEEHLGWTTQGLSERVWEQILVLGNNHPGMALALAKENYALDRVEYDGDDDSGKTMAQYNLMGDPEVPLWTAIPSTFQTPDINLDSDSRRISIELAEPSSLLEGVTITIHGSNYYQRVVSTSSGTVELDMPDLAEEMNFTITLSKEGYIPLQLEIDLPAGSSVSIVLPIVGIAAIALVVLVVFILQKMKRI